MRRRDRTIGWLYRRLPPLKYWGIRRGYLRQTGWIRSNWLNKAAAADGSPLPWYTYPAIALLAARVNPAMQVFEYGCGQSTLWWSSVAAQVHSIEDDRAWYEQVRESAPANVDLRLAASAEEYVRSVADRGVLFDVIVIDGSSRNQCAVACLDALKEDGVIVWDNTEEPNDFGPGLAHLAEKGFKRVDFHGIGPLNMDPWATALLYRPGNSFDL